MKDLKSTPQMMESDSGEEDDRLERILSMDHENSLGGGSSGMNFFATWLPSRDESSVLPPPPVDYAGKFTLLDVGLIPFGREKRWICMSLSSSF